MPTQAQRFIVHWQVGKVTIKYRAVYPPAGDIVWATYSATQSLYGGGNVTLGGALDRIRVTTVNGTDLFDAGSINIMYE